MLDRRLFRHIDWMLILFTCLLLGISLILLSSASFQSNENYYNKQIFWIAAGSVLFIIGLIFPYRWMIDLAVFLYVFSLLGLITVLLFGSRISGSKSWIRWGSISVQPSEFAKISVLLMLAAYFGKKEKKELTFFHFVIGASITILPVFFILLQPDLGTALTFFALFLFIIYGAGYSHKFMLALIIPGIAMLPVAYLFLKPYQQARLISFLNPESDPLGSGYQVIQSKIAIGSGGLTGTGFLQGSQTHLNFIPAKHTDFILSILGEEWGFLGILIMLLIYCLFILKALHNAKEAKDKFGSLLILGALSLIIFQAIINIGMVVGSMPITGLPLPLISYGGSSLFISMFSVALILNVTMRRFYYL